MKTHLIFISLAVMAMFGITFVSCGNDEPNGGSDDNGASGQYTFTLNGKTYYYGGTYDLLGLKQTTIYAGFNVFEAYGKHHATLVIAAQDVPYKMFDSEGNLVITQNFNSEVECYFNLTDFNPETAKQGDVVSISQSVKQVTSTTYFDVENHILYREKSQGDEDITYSWDDAAIGTIKFVSYKKMEDGFYLLTLDFSNLKMKKVDGDNSSFNDKSEQIVLNGKITFTDSSNGSIGTEF